MSADLGDDGGGTVTLGQLKTMLSFAMNGRDMVDVHEVLNVVETNLDLCEHSIANLVRSVEGGTQKLKDVTAALHRAQMKAVYDIIEFINDDDATVTLR